MYIPKANQTPRSSKPSNGSSTPHLARRTSPASWLGQIIPLSSDEAVIYGPVTKKDARDFGEEITHAFAGRSDVKRIEVRLIVSLGKCYLVEVMLVHTFWNRRLGFTFPAMKASEIVDRIWTAITTAQTRVNVDPVAIARESLQHGRYPEHKNPDSDSFGVVLAAWHEE